MFLYHRPMHMLRGISAWFRGDSLPAGVNAAPDHPRPPAPPHPDATPELDAEPAEQPRSFVYHDLMVGDHGYSVAFSAFDSPMQRAEKLSVAILGPDPYGKPVYHCIDQEYVKAASARLARALEIYAQLDAKAAEDLAATIPSVPE